MSIIALNYNGFNLSANSEAWFNATEMAAIYGKKVAEYLRLPATKELVNALCEIQKVGKSHLIKTKSGKNGGTWLNKDLAVDFASWLDIRFRVWCLKQIDNIINVNHDWNRARAESKSGYRIMCEIKQTVRQANGEEVKPYDFINEALVCNYALTGKWQTIERSLLSSGDLSLLERIQGQNSVYIAQGLALKERKEIIRNWALQQQSTLISQKGISYVSL